LAAPLDVEQRVLHPLPRLVELLRRDAGRHAVETEVAAGRVTVGAVLRELLLEAVEILFGGLLRLRLLLVRWLLLPGRGPGPRRFVLVLVRFFALGVGLAVALDRPTLLERPRFLRLLMRRRRLLRAARLCGVSRLAAVAVGRRVRGRTAICVLAVGR